MVAKMLGLVTALLLTTAHASPNASVTKTMMPKVIAAHDADQKNLIRLVNEIKKCGSTKNSALKAAQPSTNKYNSMSSNHQKCRRDQAVRYSSWQACLAQQRALYNEKKS